MPKSLCVMMNTDVADTKVLVVHADRLSAAEFRALLSLYI